MDGLVRLWQAQPGFSSDISNPRSWQQLDIVEGLPDGPAIIDLETFEAPVNAIGFSADGAWMFAAGGGAMPYGRAGYFPDSQDNGVRLWNMRDFQPRAGERVIQGVRDPVAQSPEGLKFASGTFFMGISPDSHWLVAAAINGPQRRWDLTAADPRQTALMMDLEGTPFFSADGRWLVEYSGASLSLQSLDAQRLAQEACDVVGRNLSDLEWDQYFPAEDYHLTCPLWPQGNPGDW